MKNLIKPALLLLVALTIITGVIYPLFVTGIAQIFFQEKANGSLMIKNGNTIGSELIGQSFDDPKYFWGRLSATGSFPYNAASSSGSNYGPTNPALVAAIQNHIDALRAIDSTDRSAIPVDLVTASASGLDPHISPAAAYYQVSRIARVRGLDTNMIRELVKKNIEARQWGFLGEPRVNVLKLNMALDELTTKQ
ncbi:potassium-transporting ATPase subunit KdpC [bacterium]|nr:potassium-transporting ATPase subunit KdpC [bacterium]